MSRMVYRINIRTLNLSLGVVLFSSLILVFFFQNCSGGFSTQNKTLQEASNKSQSPSGSHPNDSIDLPSHSQNNTAGTNTIHANLPISTIPTNSQQGQAKSLANIVSSTEIGCSLLLADFIRAKLPSGGLVLSQPRCEVGKGCGVACGKPNGSTCLSANPSAYGICIDDDEINSLILQHKQAALNAPSFNFVGDESTCETGIQKRYRLATGNTLNTANRCRVGGGCGVSCGKPNGSTCTSANPSLYGACYSYSEFSQLATHTDEESSQLFNFVAQSEEVCNRSIGDSFRAKLPIGTLIFIQPRCRIAQGCGISCGKPNGSTCLSANPNHYGACIDNIEINRYLSQNRKLAEESPYVNFVGEAATCDESIRNRYHDATGKELGSGIRCQVGGGCGVSCGKPNGSNCLSANPTLFGACYGYQEFFSL